MFKMETEEQVLSDQESVFGRFIVYAFVFCVIAYFYRKYINGRYFDKPTLCAGKVAIVTGANTGIGKETAIGLAEHEIEVFLACRNMNMANEARDDIIRLTGNQRIHCIQLDLASFASIRKFAKEFLATGKPLHILINNAGVMAHDQAKTEDGHELHIGVNHLGHFLLTMLLLPRLYESKPSRIVNVSSVAHKYAKMNRDDLMGEKKYNRFLAYAQSKLANIYFTLGIAKRLKNSGVTCNSLHPGCVFSELTRNMSSFSWLLRKCVHYFTNKYNTNINYYLNWHLVLNFQATLRCVYLLVLPNNTIRCSNKYLRSTRFRYSDG